jgi:1-acyl-sn-glycerol-3-phosphate acyltransferase
MFHGFMSHAVGPSLRLALRPRVQGAANVPAGGPFILASNHLSFAEIGRAHV